MHNIAATMAAMDIPATEPLSAVAGDTIKWSKSLSDFSAADAWVLKYRLINSAAHYDITASASGADHLVTVAASVSALWAAGDYKWVSWAEKGTERFTVASGVLTVRPNLATQVAGYDTRTHARKMLDAIEAALVGKANANQIDLLEWEANNRRSKRDPVSLLKWRELYRREVRAEESAARVAAGLDSGRIIRVRL